MNKINLMRIILADHHPQATWTLNTTIENELGIVLVGEAVDAKSLLVQSNRLHPDLILMDKELPGSPIEDLIAALHLLEPKPIVIIMVTDPKYGRLLLKAGTASYASGGEHADLFLEKLQLHKNNQFGRRMRTETKYREQPVVSEDHYPGYPHGFPPAATNH